MLYDSKGNILDTSNFTYLTSGGCANIYRDNNIVLKYYKDDCKYIYYFSKKIFKKLIELNLSSIVKLYDYYYLNKKSILSFPNAYTMEYIYNPNIILLNQSKEYLLDIISMLEKDVITLTKNKIKMYDGHHTNIIFLENSAQIIDIDLYKNNYLTNYKKLLLFNKKELLLYIKSTFLYELKQKNNPSYRNEYIFDFNILNKLSVTDYLNCFFKDGIIEQNFK